jgi:hypothetical protein
VGPRPICHEESNHDALLPLAGDPAGLSLSASLGYSFLTSNNESDTGIITTNSTLSYAFAQAVASISVFQDYRNTGISGQNFGVVQTAGYAGSFLYSFTSSTTGNLQAGYTTNGITGIGNNGSTPSSNTLTAGRGLRWQVLSWLSSSVQYTYTVGNSATAPPPGAAGPPRAAITPRIKCLSAWSGTSSPHSRRC